MVEMKLAACAQISAIESFYTWDGATQQDPEWRILFKTTRRNYAAVEAAIRERHPYQLPAIYSVAVDDAFGRYAEWVAQEALAGNDPPSA
jgi:periplasmic divalent cation tolerance protein